MNGAHWHLVVNHLPIMATYLSLPLLILALFRRNDRGFLFSAIILLVFAGIGAGLALATGDPAEDVVMGLPGVNEHFIKAHENQADNAGTVAIFIGVIGLGLLIWIVEKKFALYPLWIPVALLMVTLVSAVMMTIVGYTGGKIHHTEILNGTDVRFAAPPSAAPGLDPATQGLHTGGDRHEAEDDDD